jgi:hypothetical protein
MLDVYLYDASDVIRKNGMDAINSFATGDMQIKLTDALDRLCNTATVNVGTLRRKIAEKVIENNKYCF